MKETTQTESLYNLLKDGTGHNNFEIFHTLGIWRVSARIWDLKKKLKLDEEIETWHDREDRRKYWYRLIKKDEKIEEMKKVIEKVVFEQPTERLQLNLR